MNTPSKRARSTHGESSPNMLKRRKWWREYASNEFRWSVIVAAVRVLKSDSSRNSNPLTIGSPGIESAVSAGSFGDGSDVRRHRRKTGHQAIIDRLETLRAGIGR